MFSSQVAISQKIEHLMSVFVDSEAEIRPHFFLTGPSGSGKSYLTKQIAEKCKVGFMDINAAQLTSEGISGNSLTKALRPLRNKIDKPCVIFMDEFDKLFQSNGTETGSYRSDVQNEILHLLEAMNASVFGDYGKYESIPIDKTLFVFAGSFSNQKVESVKDLMDLGVRREFVGRVPLVYSTQKIEHEELKKALPEISLFKSYLKFYPGTNVKNAIKGICAIMLEQSKQADLGVRLLNSAVHQYFMAAK